MTRHRPPRPGHGQRLRIAAPAGPALVATMGIAALGACGGPPPSRPQTTPQASAWAVAAQLADTAAFNAAPADAQSMATSDETLLAKLLRARPALAELDSLYIAGSRRYAEHDLDLAEEHFYLLRERLDQEHQAHPDSLSLIYLESIGRKLQHFAHILAEERFFADSYSPVTQTLTEAYDSLRTRYHIPAFMVPARAEGPDAFAREVLAVDNEQVRYWQEYFCTRAHDHFQVWLERRESVGPVITSILKDEGLPEELLYVAMIESGLHHSVRSRAGAVGYWQFIRATARNHGLKVNEWLDERRDLEKSTRAACQYLKMLHRMFQSWPLALAAYNAGEYRIQRAVALDGEANYWTMPLPKQTREYVPKVVAAYRIAQDPQSFGFTAPSPDTLRYAVVKLDGAYGLDQIARAAGVAESQLRELNPQLLAGCTPPGVKGYELRVPSGAGDKLLAALVAIPEGSRITWRQHRVQPGETLGQIARQYRTNVDAIMELNGIANVRAVRGGRVLTIPYPQGVKPPAEEVAAVVETASRAAASGRSTDPPLDVTEQTHRRIEYRVRKGDTLHAIGRQFGVQVKDLVVWNHLSRNAKIFPGDVLSIWQPRATQD
jgi:membrane-bound lytic murein transglycosylase D